MPLKPGRTVVDEATNILAKNPDWQDKWLEISYKVKYHSKTKDLEIAGLKMVELTRANKNAT